MKYINWNRLPADPDGMSFADTKKGYKLLYQRLLECKRMKGATEGVLATTRKGEREAQSAAAALKREVAMISKKAAAAKSLRETSGWSGVAIGSVTLLWAGFAEYGYPGPRWLFEHDIFYGAVCWTSTSLFAWAAKAFYDAR